MTPDPIEIARQQAREAAEAYVSEYMASTFGRAVSYVLDRPWIVYALAVVAMAYVGGSTIMTIAGCQ